MCTRCLSCISVRSLSKISFLPSSFGKRVQRYDLFPNWQNNSLFFFKKNKKNEQIGQKDEEKEEEKATHACILRSNLQITRLC